MKHICETADRVSGGEKEGHMAEITRRRRALESLRGQSPWHQHESEEQQRLEEALECAVHTLPPYSPWVESRYPMA